MSKYSANWLFPEPGFPEMTINPFPPDELRIHDSSLHNNLSLTGIDIEGVENLKSFEYCYPTVKNHQSLAKKK